MKIIRIREFDENKILAVHLKDILSLCGSKYEDRVWLVYDIDETNWDWYQRWVNAPEGILKLDYKEILDYANSVKYTLEGFFLALKKNVEYNKINIESNIIKEICDIMIQYVDASLVEVSTDDESCIERLKKKYKNVEVDVYGKSLPYHPISYGNHKYLIDFLTKDSTL